MGIYSLSEELHHKPTERKGYKCRQAHGDEPKGFFSNAFTKEVMPKVTNLDAIAAGRGLRLESDAIGRKHGVQQRCPRGGM
jgi:hypothetical protein